MKNRFIPHSLLALAFAGCSAMHVNASELKVSGSIHPSACELSVNGNEFTIPQQDLDKLPPDRSTELSTITLPGTVTCAFPARFGLQFADTATVDGGFDDIFHIYPSNDSSKSLGWYEVRLANGQADTKSYPFARRKLDNNAMTLDNKVRSKDHDHVMVLAGGSTLSGARHATFDINITPSLKPRGEFGAVNEVDIVGQMVMELLYL